MKKAAKKSDEELVATVKGDKPPRSPAKKPAPARPTTTTDRTHWQQAAVVLQRFSENKPLQNGLRSVLTTARQWEATHVKYRDDFSEFFYQLSQGLPRGEHRRDGDEVMKAPEPTTLTALLIDGPRRADWRMVEVAGDVDAGLADLQRCVGGAIEYTWVVDGLTVYGHEEGLFRYEPFVRAVQRQPNALYGDGVMVLHGPTIVLGPGDANGRDTSFTPDMMKLAELVFVPVAP
jgi:hypothetical protein